MNDLLNFLIQVGLAIQANPLALLLIGIPLYAIVAIVGGLKDNDPRG